MVWLHSKSFWIVYRTMWLLKLGLLLEVLRCCLIIVYFSVSLEIKTSSKLRLIFINFNVHRINLGLKQNSRFLFIIFKFVRGFFISHGAWKIKDQHFQNETFFIPDAWVNVIDVNNLPCAMKLRLIYTPINKSETVWNPSIYLATGIYLINFRQAQKCFHLLQPLQI